LSQLRQRIRPLDLCVYSTTYALRLMGVLFGGCSAFKKSIINSKRAAVFLKFHKPAKKKRLKILFANLTFVEFYACESKKDLLVH
jgi:hypothetical protein